MPPPPARAVARAENELTRKTAELVSWASQVLERASLAGFTVARSPRGAGALATRSSGGEPNDPLPARRLDVELVAVEAAPPARDVGPAPLQFRARYRLTAWSEDPDEQEAALAELVFAGLDASGWDAELANAESAGRAAGTGSVHLFVSTLVQRLPKPAETKRVRQVRIDMRSASDKDSLRGVVLGPDGTPLSQALIEWNTLSLSARSDERGRFEFRRVPAGQSQVQLRVRAKGRQWVVTAARPAPAAELELKLDF